MRYLGHAGRTTTDIYQQRAITKKELAEDALKLKNWVERELAKSQGKDDKNWVPRANVAIAGMFAIQAMAEQTNELSQLPEFEEEQK